MAKWEKVMDNKVTGTGSKAERVKKDKIFNKMTRTASSKDLKKESDEAFVAKQAREDSLVAAFEAKKLKSKSLIKEAKKLVAERAKKATAAAKQEASAPTPV